MNVYVAYVHIVVGKTQTMENVRVGRRARRGPYGTWKFQPNGVAPRETLARQHRRELLQQQQRQQEEQDRPLQQYLQEQEQLQQPFPIGLPRVEDPLQNGDELHDEENDSSDDESSQAYVSVDFLLQVLCDVYCL